MVCTNCGLVEAERYIDPGQDWRSYNNGDGNNRIRTGAPPSLILYDKGLSTFIGQKNKDALGRDISPNKKIEIHRLRQCNKRSKLSESAARSLFKSMSEIDRLCDALHLYKNTKEEAAKLYREVFKKKLSCGRSISGLVASVIYLICKQLGIPKSTAEIANFSDAEKKEINRNYLLLCKEFKIKSLFKSPIEFLPKFASELSLSAEYENLVRKLLIVAEKRGITLGKDPKGLCAGAIYLVGKIRGVPPTQSSLAAVSKSTETTIRNRWKELADKFNIKFKN